MSDLPDFSVNYSRIHSLTLRVIFDANWGSKIKLMRVLHTQHQTTPFLLLLFANTLQIPIIVNTSCSKLCFSFQTLHQLLIDLTWKDQCKIL